MGEERKVLGMLNLKGEPKASGCPIYCHKRLLLPEEFPHLSVNLEAASLPSNYLYQLVQPTWFNNQPSACSALPVALLGRINPYCLPSAHSSSAQERTISNRLKGRGDCHNSDVQLPFEAAQLKSGKGYKSSKESCGVPWHFKARHNTEFKSWLSSPLEEQRIPPPAVDQLSICPGNSHKFMGRKDLSSVAKA